MSFDSAEIGDPMNPRCSIEMDFILQIERARALNNVNWMGILRIAMRHAPEETKALLRGINRQDGVISDLLKSLSC
jgi:hypothetical protein